MLGPLDTLDLVSDAHATLRRQILEGKLAMGERLNVVRLARELSSSRTPVREALSRLTAEGFATFIPNRGHFVAVYSAGRVAEIYGCRAVLESEAARLAARVRIPAADRAEMERIVEEIDDWLGRPFDDGVAHALIGLNNAFHELIYAQCPNGELRRLITQVTTIPRSIRNYFRFSHDQLNDSNKAHRVILRAIVTGDGDRAAAAMREHIWSARDRVLPPQDGSRDAPNVRAGAMGLEDASRTDFHPEQGTIR